jgi:hypothetical protein
VISPGETGILYSQHVHHRRTRPEQDYVAHQENHPAGCSNWFVLFIWFIWSVWFNQTNETNQITVFFGWRAFSASC